MNSNLVYKDNLIVALDVDSLKEAETIVRELKGYVRYFKVGYQLAMNVSWPQAIDLVTTNGAKVFVDSKLHDIPNTVSKAVSALAKQNVAMTTIHLSSGEAALREANQAKGAMQLFGVTLLTSLNENDSQAIYHRSPQETVLSLARLAAETGLDGIVCSVAEIPPIKQQSHLNYLLLMTPGIRPTGNEADDQARTATPKQAIQAGANFLVLGRAVTAPPQGMSRRQAIEHILAELKV